MCTSALPVADPATTAASWTWRGRHGVISPVHVLDDVSALAAAVLLGAPGAADAKITHDDGLGTTTHHCTTDDAPTAAPAVPQHGWNGGPQES